RVGPAALSGGHVGGGRDHLGWDRRAAVQWIGGAGAEQGDLHAGEVGQFMDGLCVHRGGDPDGALGGERGLGGERPISDRGEVVSGAVGPPPAWAAVAYLPPPT